MIGRMLHGATKTVERADGHIEHDPANMSDRHVFLGLCGPRAAVFCEQCGADCGYYRQVKMRGIDLQAIREHERQREERRKLLDTRKSHLRRERKNGTDDT